MKYGKHYRRSVKRFYERAYNEPKQRWLKRTGGKYRWVGKLLNRMGRGTIESSLRTGAHGYRVNKWGFTRYTDY